VRVVTVNGRLASCLVVIETVTRLQVVGHQ
jgi:hypothetical protein